MMLRLPMVMVVSADAHVQGSSTDANLQLLCFGTMKPWSIGVSSVGVCKGTARNEPNGVPRRQLSSPLLSG